MVSDASSSCCACCAARGRETYTLGMNQFAALTNSEFHHFRKENRIEVDLGKLGFLVMNELWAELAELKEGEKRRAAEEGKTPGKKRSKGEPLRERDPW